MAGDRQIEFPFGRHQWRCEPLADVTSPQLQLEVVPLRQEESRCKPLNGRSPLKLDLGRHEHLIGALLEATALQSAREGQIGKPDYGVTPQQRMVHCLVGLPGVTPACR